MAKQTDSRIKALQNALNVRGDGLLLLELEGGGFRSSDGQFYEPSDLPVLKQRYELIVIWDNALYFDGGRS